MQYITFKVARVVNLKLVFADQSFCNLVVLIKLFINFFNWDSLHARLNSHYESWNYKKQ